MRDRNRSIRCPNYVLMGLAVVVALLSAPAVAQDVDPGPRFNLEPELVETFDDSNSPGWDIGAGVTVADGILRLEGGTQGSYEGDWQNYTTLVRVRQTGSGGIGLTFTTSGGDSVRLALSSDGIEAERTRSGLTVDMIVERPIQEPPEVPVGEWFTLHVTQLGTPSSWAQTECGFTICTIRALIPWRQAA